MGATITFPGTNLNSAVIIPALNPQPGLVDFVKELLGQGFPRIIVVDDGSASAYKYIFQEIAALENCTVLTHEINQGKGRALKTAFAHVRDYFPWLDGVVTADADGQHAVEDICRIAGILAEHKNFLVLGVRNFREKHVPRRSFIGNTLTSHVFRFLYGVKLHDTQTGLRGIPLRELAWMIDMAGERYEYELNMLIKAKYQKVRILTIPIRTIYYNNNAHSHYSTFKDSIPIFFCLISGLLKYSGSTAISGIIDTVSFYILNTLLLAHFAAAARLLPSTAIARLLSSLCNFTINRKLIFAVEKDNLAGSQLRYYSLCLIQMLTSYILVYYFSLQWTVNESVIKLFVDFFLGCISYQVQLHWVFRNKYAETTTITGI